ncbi:MAG: SPOR domain-containing protein, partial [Bacteroidota bacterium]
FWSQKILILWLTLLPNPMSTVQSWVLGHLCRSLQEEVDFLRGENSTLRGVSDNLEMGPVSFHVQIGAFKNVMLTDFTQEAMFLTTSQEDGWEKMVLGSFQTYEEAKSIRTFAKQLGFRDAFVVGRVGGRRTALSEAISTAKQQFDSSLEEF